MSLIINRNFKRHDLVNFLLLTIIRNSNDNHSHKGKALIIQVCEWVMYICNCNGITDKEVETALNAGVERWDDVHAFYGCEPCCGQCQCEIVEAIVDRDSNADDALPAAAMAMAG